MQHYYALILAGGGGTRLWPMSRQEKPKQMLPLLEERSMFHTCVERLHPLFIPERIYISTTLEYIDALQEEAPNIPADNFIAEPSRRNNAAAVGLAIAIIQKRDPEAVVAILTADHHIQKQQAFKDVLRAAYTIASQDYIVTLGISPSFPATGFGYIQQGETLGEVKGFAYHQAEKFTEKPDVVRATQFIASGKYSWNSGMFIWRAARAMEEFQRQQTPIYALLKQLRPSIDTPDYQSTLQAIWDEMPKVSIDYAIMEGAQKMVVIPVDIGWSDVGSWASLYEVLPQDPFGNCGKDQHPEDKRVVLDTHDTLVYTDKLVVSIGVKNLIVVETDDVLMICHKDRAQDVREIVKYLRDNNMDDYL